MPDTTDTRSVRLATPNVVVPTLSVTPPRSAHTAPFTCGSDLVAKTLSGPLNLLPQWAVA